MPHKDPAERLAYRRRRNVRIRAETFAAYGGRCACCGETEDAFLQIDHEDGNGAAHRESLGGRNRAGIFTYVWLRQNGWPPGFRVLCANCHAAISRLGSCPHATPPH
jgi:hypothetical protein